jgi:hypothetical protein
MADGCEDDSWFLAGGGRSRPKSSVLLCGRTGPLL